MSNDGKFVIASYDTKLAIFSIDKKSKRGELNFESTQNSFTYLNLNSTPYLISGGSDGILRLININTQTVTQEIEMPMHREISKVLKFKDFIRVILD